jgi:micrococcal nuclease
MVRARAAGRSVLGLGAALLLFGATAIRAPAQDGGHTALPVAVDPERANFTLCQHQTRTNCIVDGDTFWFQGRKIRIADIDTPEIHPARCAEEARLGAAATGRLMALLNAGSFTLQAADRDRDFFGRDLRVVTRAGQSIGGALVKEGLARWYAGGRKHWC